MLVGPQVKEEDAGSHPGDVGLGKSLIEKHLSILTVVIVAEGKEHQEEKGIELVVFEGAKVVHYDVSTILIKFHVFKQLLRLRISK